MTVLLHRCLAANCLPRQRSVFDRRLHRAFTLIELLVVITIIAVLAGLLLPVVSKVTQNAQKVQAKSTEMQIVAAIKSFQTDYGTYPVLSTDQPCDSTGAVEFGESSPTSGVLMDVLRADGFGRATTLNPRQVVYLEMPAAKSSTQPKNGISTTGTTAGWPMDPWGRTYFIKVDAAYVNAVGNPYTANTAAGFNPIGTGAIAWSFGPDGQSGNDKTVAPALDDVISWQ